MSKDKSDDTSFGAYDHLKKEVAQKDASRGAGTAGTSIPTVMKVFMLGLIIFGGLLFSGALTGPGPFGGPDDSEFQGQYIPEGDSNIQSLENMCVTHGSSISDHYHFNIRILIDGTPQNIPPNIGITSDCMKPIHTHEGDGKVHIELPVSYEGTNPNIGDFFGIWGYDFSENQVMGQTGDVTMKVNTEEKSGNLQFFIPQNNDFVEITLTT